MQSNLNLDDQGEVCQKVPQAKYDFPNFDDFGALSWLSEHHFRHFLCAAAQKQMFRFARALVGVGPSLRALLFLAAQ